MDGANSKAEVNSSEMRKFLQAVTEAELNQKPAPVAKPAVSKPVTTPSSNLTADEMVAILSGQKTQAQIMADREAKKADTGVKEAELTQPVAAPASTLSPEQLAYNQLRAQLDGANAIRGGGANTFAVVSPEVTAKTTAMRTKLAQMAAALKAKGIDAAAEYDAPDPAAPAAAPVDLAKKYNDEPVAENVGMSRLLSIISEGKGPLNRSTSAEALTMQHYTEPKKTITNPVLNVQEGATPSMIGKYFKAVETELAEAATRSKDRSRQLAERVVKKVIEQDITRRVTPNADGSLPDPSINRLTGKPNPPAAEPGPSNVKSGGPTVEYGGETYDVMVFGDKGIRPRIARSDKVVSAKVYTMGNKMFVILDAPTQEGVEEGVAGPKDCWPGHRKVGTQPGTGKNAGKRVNNCEKIKKEAVNPAQQAAIAIAKKKAGKK